MSKGEIMKQPLYDRGYTFRIYPKGDQVLFLERTFGHARKVWNTLLDRNMKQYELSKLGQTDKPKVSPYDLGVQCTALKRELGFEYLNEVSFQALKHSAMNLGHAFKRFFKEKKGYPQFKSKHTSRKSFTLVNASSEPSKYFKIVDGKLYIAKMMDCPIKVKWTNELPSLPSQVTITRDADGKYYASFLCKRSPRMTFGQGVIGVDLGISTLASLSDGTKIENPKYYVKTQKKLRRLQKSLSRKKKGSKNRDKARSKVAKCHSKIVNQRKHYMHCLTRRLVNDNQVIVVEDLHVKGMVRNRKLSKHILDAGMGMFRRFVTYKVQESHWTKLVIVDRFFPSTQLCNACGQLSDVKIVLGVKSWICQNCKTLHDRDTNAGLNLVNHALANSRLWINAPGKVTAIKGAYS
jgi:putative transposase